MAKLLTDMRQHSEFELLSIWPTESGQPNGMSVSDLPMRFISSQEHIFFLLKSSVRWGSTKASLAHAIRNNSIGSSQPLTRFLAYYSAMVTRANRKTLFVRPQSNTRIIWISFAEEQYECGSKEVTRSNLSVIIIISIQSSRDTSGSYRVQPLGLLPFHLLFLLFENNFGAFFPPVNPYLIIARNYVHPSIMSHEHNRKHDIKYWIK